jgi:hypothetical protein
MEKELLNLAIEIMEMNKEIKPMLTGSLMLFVRGIDKRREASDIDILVNDVNWEKINLPEGFNQSSPNYPDSIQFKKGDMKIDFLLSEEIAETVNGINCGSVKLMLDRKYSYYLQDAPRSSEKHRLDLEFLGYDFPIVDNGIF